MAWIKNNIKALRKQQGLRQEDLAKLVGVTRQTIIAIEMERYNPSLELALRLCEVFGKNVEEVFSVAEIDI